MGFSRELAWFQNLGLAGRRKTTAKRPGDHEAWVSAPAFDAADAMELGISRELTTGFTKPEPKSATGRKMRVERSTDRLQHVLVNEEGNPILVAHTVEAQNCIKLFTPGEDPQARGARNGDARPAFTLSFDDSRTNWKLTSKCCEKCVYRMSHNSCSASGGQTLMRATHYKEEVGKGIALCMDVDLPDIALPNGGKAIWCSLCEGATASRMELTTRRPTWSSRLGSLTMDFKGRVKCASAKNVQLCLNKANVMLFGKQEPGIFTLDFEHPMSLVQAFGVALSTTFWT